MFGELLTNKLGELDRPIDDYSNYIIQTIVIPRPHYMTLKNICCHSKRVNFSVGLTTYIGWIHFTSLSAR